MTLPRLQNRSVLLIGRARLTFKILVTQADFEPSDGHSFTMCFIKLQARARSVFSWLESISQSDFRDNGLEY